MPSVETSIEIEASPQTVWSILDDLNNYPEWNPVAPMLSGRTTVGQGVNGRLTIEGLPERPLGPTISRVIAARDFRWLTLRPDEFSAEHIFVLQPIERGTRLVHREIFGGPIGDSMADTVEQYFKPAYEKFNLAIKDRAETLACKFVSIHPCVDHRNQGGIEPRRSSVIRCQCKTDRIEIAVSEAASHNHLCGCSKCWRPNGALFAQVAVVPTSTIEVIRNEENLAIVDPEQLIQRHACIRCGAHLFGRTEDPNHHFYGSDFVHPELMSEGAAGRVEFAGFVSSLIETGVSASSMESIRTQLAILNIRAYDVFSPEIMDIIAYHKVKVS